MVYSPLPFWLKVEANLYSWVLFLSPTTSLLALSDTWSLEKQGESTVKPDITGHVTSVILTKKSFDESYSNT